MRTGEPLPAVGEVLVSLATGVWHWDTATGLVTVDAEAARLLGLPAEETVLTEAQTRARLHPVDWNEITGVVQLAVAEGTLAEVRIRIMDERGTVVRVVRSRSKPSFDPVKKAYELIGTLQEVTEPTPGTAAGRTAVTGDWRRSREAFLLDAGRALAEARSTEEVLRVAAALSMPGFSPAGLAVFGVTGDRLTIIGHHGQQPGDEAPFTQMSLQTDYPAAEVVRTGRAVYLSSPERYKERYPLTWPMAAPFGRYSWAFVPLTVAGRTMGAWMAAFAYPVAFTPDERSVLTTVARMLAQALTRAGAAETQRELTDGLQRSMLPTLGPEIPGLTLAARYIPTGGGLQVGGDWYDMIPLPGGASRARRGEAGSPWSSGTSRVMTCARRASWGNCASRCGRTRPRGTAPTPSCPVPRVSCTASRTETPTCASPPASMSRSTRRPACWKPRGPVIWIRRSGWPTERCWSGRPRAVCRWASTRTPTTPRPGSSWSPARR